MDIPEEKLINMLSKMLQMFPNVPKDITSLYVQRYSTDIEMCTEMLRLQSGKYMNMKIFSNDSNNVNGLKDCFQSPHFLLHTETLSVNNNDLTPSDQLCIENKGSMLINFENFNKQNNAVSSNSRDFFSPSQISSNAVQGTNVLESLKKKGTFSNNFNEPLKLDIALDDEGISHSWRPNMTDEGDLSDIFYVNERPRPSKKSNGFILNKEDFSDIFYVKSPRSVRNVFSCISERPRTSKENWRKIFEKPIPKSKLFKNIQLEFGEVPSTYLSSDMEAEVRRNLYSDSHEYSPCNKSEVDKTGHFTVGPTINLGHLTDVPGYVNTQKCCLNHMWFDYTMTMNEYENLKECVGKLDAELKEKMELVKVEVIMELNKEIVALRSECQCLCSEVDNLHQGLLGEVDEKHYEENKASSENSDSQSGKTDQNLCTNSHSKNITESPGESSLWKCPACTYDNYSAVDVCEMCRTPKPPLMPPFVNAQPNSCYCHTKKDSLPLQS